MSSTVVSPDLAKEIVKLMRVVAKEDIYVRILLVLAQHGPTTLRRLSISVGMSPKNVKRYVEKLSSLGLVDVEKVSPRHMIIMLRPEYSFLSKLTKQEDVETMCTATTQ